MEKSTKTSIEKRSETSGDLVAYTIKGKVTVEDIKEVHDDLLALLDRYKKLKLLVSIEQMEGIEPAAIIEDLKFTLHYLDDFSALAVVGDKKWQELLTKFSDVLLEYKVKYFQASETDQALEWLKNLDT
jgi:hypothetical protein